MMGTRTRSNGASIIDGVFEVLDVLNVALNVAVVAATLAALARLTSPTPHQDTDRAAAHGCVTWCGCGCGSSSCGCHT